MANLNTRIEKLERQKRVHPDREKAAHPDCLCFPSNEPPLFGTDLELELAEGVKCPQHGNRFERPALLVFRSHWIRKMDSEHDWPYHSRQYAKAMRVSFPVDYFDRLDEEAVKKHFCSGKDNTCK